jgi:CMP-N-acetylneuraminic acid synthetase
MSPHVVGFIFARGNSKGVPKKNLRLLAGKPLIAYAIESARACKLIDRVIVSTENAEIAAVARRYGAELPFMRPRELAKDDSPEWFAWQHAIRLIKQEDPKMDMFVSISPTSPLRATEDISACIRLLSETAADLVLTVVPAAHNPYFNMVILDDQGNAKLVIPSPQIYEHRQEAPQVYEITTVAYAARPDFVLTAHSMFDGKTRAVIVPRERALDIDTELDLAFAEFLMNQSLTENRQKSAS